METNSLLPEGRGVCRQAKIIKGDKEIQAPSYKINKSWGYNVQIWNIVNDIIITLYGGGW